MQGIIHQSNEGTLLPRGTMSISRNGELPGEIPARYHRIDASPPQLAEEGRSLELVHFPVEIV